MATTRLLFAMLGGEGGSVVTGWIMNAARSEGRPAQATSVPGVAQRTGATTYYIELAGDDELAKPPIFALMPVAGDVDIVVSSELLEAARMVERGYVAVDRTFLLAATHRVLTTIEKMPPGDGRFDDGALREAIAQASRDHRLLDVDGICRVTGAAVNAVLLGALAGLELLPIAGAALRAAIEAGGIAVERNLAGFDAGLRAALDGAASPPEPEPEATGPVLDDGWRARLERLPEPVREYTALGIVRLVGYQDGAYAERYLARLEPFLDAPELARRVARHLAVRMSYEDVIRVAQLKASAARLERVRVEVGAAADEPVEIVDYFRPGIPEIADILPLPIGRRLQAWAAARGEREKYGFALHNRTSSVGGYLRVWLLAKLRRWRPRSLRFHEEQQAIESWLALVGEARQVSEAFALATADLARIVKGYGETYRRGQASYRELVERYILPVLAAGGERPESPESALQAALVRALATTT